MFRLAFIIFFMLTVTSIAESAEFPGGRDRNELMNIIYNNNKNIRGLIFDVADKKILFVDFVNDNPGSRQKKPFFKISESNWTVNNNIRNRLHHAWGVNEKNELILVDQMTAPAITSYERVDDDEWKIRCNGKYVTVSDTIEKFQFGDKPENTINVRKLLLTDKDGTAFTIKGGSK